MVSIKSGVLSDFLRSEGKSKNIDLGDQLRGVVSGSGIWCFLTEDSFY